MTYHYRPMLMDNALVEVQRGKGGPVIGRLRRVPTDKGLEWYAKPRGGVESPVPHPNRESAARAMDPNPESVP